MQFPAKRTGVPGICWLIVVFALCAASTLVRAQHVKARGFRPGRGFHAGPAGRFQSFSGYRGEYHASIVSSPGRHEVYWGHPGYVWAYPYYGWRFGLGFGSGPYTYAPGFPYGYGLFPYWYGNGTWTAPPVYHPEVSQCDYRYESYENCDTQQSPATHSVPKQSLKPPSSNPDLEEPTDSDQDAARATNLVAYRRPMRREVQNALNALRRMPPSSRQRRIASGRYNNFSFEEQEVLRRISDDRPVSAPALR